jgi:hypothetical protein
MRLAGIFLPTNLDLKKNTTRYRWEDNKVGLKETGYEVVDRIYFNQKTDQRRELAFHIARGLLDQNSKSASKVLNCSIASVVIKM